MISLLFNNLFDLILLPKLKLNDVRFISGPKLVPIAQPTQVPQAVDHAAPNLLRLTVRLAPLTAVTVLSELQFCLLLS